MAAFFVVLLLGLGGGGWLVAPSIAEQADALSGFAAGGGRAAA